MIRGYGCESGCCGHIMDLGEDREVFVFSHPWYDDDRRDLRRWAREVFEDKIRGEYPDCIDSIDWDTLDVSEVTDNC